MSERESMSISSLARLSRSSLSHRGSFAGTTTRLDSNLVFKLCCLYFDLLTQYISRSTPVHPTASPGSFCPSLLVQSFQLSCLRRYTNTCSPIVSTMRFVSILAILPALALAQEQIPLADRVQGWFDKAKSYLPTATPVIPVIEKLADAPKQALQELTVTPFNTSNWQSLLTPASQPEDWFVFITGGNKSCFGRCDTAEKAFNVSTPPNGQQGIATHSIRME